MKNTVCKVSKDSYSGKTIDEKKMIGTWQLTALSKAGLKTHDTERIIAFYYYAYQASMLGYDYVILSGKRTNSGRDEAVKTTAVNIRAGERLYKSGYCPAFRKPYDHPAKICKGDIRVPCLEEPKSYAGLPEISILKPVDKSEASPKEDEILSLIDCLTGEGDKAKAFRAIARFMVQEAIRIEEKEEAGKEAE